MRVSYGIFTVPNKSFELRRCLNYGKSNYRESTVYVSSEIFEGITYLNTSPEFLPLSSVVSV